MSKATDGPRSIHATYRNGGYVLLAIKDIRLDGGTQVRLKMNDDVVEDYAKLIEEGKSLPAVTVFRVGDDIYLADGFTRLKSHLKAGKAEINADLKHGSLNDALVFAIKANQKHGQRLTRDDKRNAVLAIIKSDELSMKLNDSEIASLCGVAQSFVSNVRASTKDPSQQSPILKISDDCEANGCEPEKPSEKIPYTNKHGQRQTMASPASTRSKRGSGGGTRSANGEIPKNGSVIFSKKDWKEFHNDCAKMMRYIGKIGFAYKSFDTPDARSLERQMLDWRHAFKAWYHKVTGKVPEKDIDELVYKK